MFDLSKVRIVKDFPIEGVQFYDITTIMNDAVEYEKVFNELLAETKKLSPDVIVAMEARGFFFGPSLALALHIPFVPIRKKGKLPFHTYSESFGLEYGFDNIEIHQDAFAANQSVLLFDDVLATGGTAQAAVKLLRRFNPTQISALFLLELKSLNGKEKLSDIPVVSLAVV